MQNRAPESPEPRGAAAAAPEPRGAAAPEPLPDTPESPEPEPTSPEPALQQDMPAVALDHAYDAPLVSCYRKKQF